MILNNIMEYIDYRYKGYSLSYIFNYKKALNTCISI